MARFYVDLELAVGNQYDLPIEVVRHINVVRIRSTDEIVLFNNQGNDYLAKFIELDKRKATVEILSTDIVNNELPIRVTLLMSVIASDKFDLVVQKSVELGVTEIIPIYSQNTQRLKADKLRSRLLHWQNIIISASEQSGRAKLMSISHPLEFADALENIIASQKYILSPHHAGWFVDSSDSCSKIALLIGPEGGFTEEEVKIANQQGYKSVILGNRILRAETAAISAVNVALAKLGYF